ncbi:hypothetical protein MMC20_000378 [Loxospora ochrophaea]|nr:hypothetical protein [Loxospora ochrophaea]
MTTAKRRRGRSLHLDLPDANADSGPSVAAVFLIDFDVKVGYTLAWKQSIPDLKLLGVEFKSLPSGLHNVKEDLVYFVHDDEYAGISAFVNEPDADLERNASMLAVGALVPRSFGRLGKSWQHAEALKDLARQLVKDPTKSQLLDDFWEANRILEPRDTPEQDGGSLSPQLEKTRRKVAQLSPAGPRRARNRAVSSGSALAPMDQGLSSHHPALSLPDLLDSFGPLVFTLYKAALLRKRLLLVTPAPVQLCCNYVYDLSVLSNIPASVSASIPLEPLPTRIQPLFSVGLHDTEILTTGSRHDQKTGDVVDDDAGYGWIACTTDDVLAMKSGLYDVLVKMPPWHAKQAREKVWPRVQGPDNSEIRASQRDLRRYRVLRRGLRRQSSRSRAASSEFRPSPDHGHEDSEPILLPVKNTHETFDDASSTIDEQLIEPLSWSALAYSSFMWWASAGETPALEEEAEQDAALLQDFTDTSPGRPRSNRRRSNPSLSATMSGGPPAVPEMAIIAYFHRLTARILGKLAEVVEAQDGEEEGENPHRDHQGAEDPIIVENEDMTRMGLDVWSESDRDFVRELLDFYWGRKAEILGGRVECCGVRIC